LSRMRLAFVRPKSSCMALVNLTVEETNKSWSYTMKIRSWEAIKCSLDKLLDEFVITFSTHSLMTIAHIQLVLKQFLILPLGFSFRCNKLLNRHLTFVPQSRMTGSVL